MSDSQQITGDPQVDSDINALLEFAADAQRLAQAEQAMQNEKLTLKGLQGIIPPSVFRAVFGLLEINEIDNELNAIDHHRLRQAQALVREHFETLSFHPAVVRQLRQEAFRASSARQDPDDGDNVIAGLGWEPIWREVNGELVPAMLLRLRGEGDSQKLLLASKVGWDDISFLIRALCEILVSHMERGRPYAEAKLLKVPDADKIMKELGAGMEAIQKAHRLFADLGIQTQSGEVEEVDQPER